MDKLLTAAHVDEVLGMYGTNVLGEKKEGQKAGQWAFNGDGHVIICVNTLVYQTINYEQRKDFEGKVIKNVRYTKLGERVGQLVLSMFCGTILEYAETLCNLKVVKNSYAEYLKDDNKYFVWMAGKKVRLYLLDCMCRMMQCLGADIVDVHVNGTILQFVAKHGRRIAAICVVNTLTEDTPLQPMGGIVVHNTNDSTEVDEILATDYMQQARQYLEKAKEDKIGSRKLFKVQLVKYEWCFVYANTEKAAKEIAIDNAYEMDWDEGAEAEYVEDGDIDDIGYENKIFDETGEIEYEELEELMEEKWEEDEEEEDEE